MYPNAPNLEVAQGDFENEPSIGAALDGADTLLIIPPEKLERFSAIDATIKLANDYGVGHTVLFSVSKGLDQTAIGRKFHAWERVLEHHSQAYTIVQSTFFHDLMFHFAPQIKSPNHQIHHWLGTGKFCPVDSRDVGEALAAVLREGPLIHHRQTYSLYGPQMLSFQDMVDKLSIVLGYQVQAYPDITSEQVRNSMDDKLPSFNIEEVVQAQETIGMGHDMNMTPDLLKLIGYAHTAQRFFEDNYFTFMGHQRAPLYQVMQTPASPSSVTSNAIGRTTTATTVIEQRLISTPPKEMGTTDAAVQTPASDQTNIITETSIDQSAQMSPTKIKPGTATIPVPPPQPAVES
jgi:uncharacterized protein YbjT (DUF2867 family)